MLQSKTMKGARRKRRESEGPSDLCVAGDLDWISLLGTSNQHQKALFSSPDIPQVIGGEHVLCSPLTLPTTINAALPVEVPVTPHMVQSHGALLEEVVLKQDSPSPQVLLPWAEGNSPAPSCSAQTHPWAESKESTMHEVRNLKMDKCHTGKNMIWSPDHSWSSTSTHSSSSVVCRTPLLKGTTIY